MAFAALISDWPSAWVSTWLLMKPCTWVMKALSWLHAAPVWLASSLVATWLSLSINPLPWFCVSVPPAISVSTSSMSDAIWSWGDVFVIAIKKGSFPTGMVSRWRLQCWLPHLSQRQCCHYRSPRRQKIRLEWRQFQWVLIQPARWQPLH